MAEVRAVWVLRASDLKCITSRRFPTVERRVKEFYKEEYKSVPSDHEICNWFHSVAQIFVSQFSGTPIPSSYEQFPLELKGSVQIQTIDKCLRPFIWSETEDNVVLLVLPRLESFQITEESLSDENFLLTCATMVGLRLCDDIGKFVHRFASNQGVSLSAELQIYFAEAMPLGRPIDTDMSRVTFEAKQGFGSTTSQYKRPGWKPYLHKGKEIVTIQQKELISCSQYDNPNRADWWSVSGVVECEALLDGVPEVYMTLSPKEVVDQNSPTATAQAETTVDTSSVATDSYSSLSLRNISTQSLRTIECSGISPKVKFLASSRYATTRAEMKQRLAFIPPLEKFNLLTYMVEDVTRAYLPFRGFLQVKEISPSELRMLLQLKLSSYASQDFEYCECRIPFHGVGEITTAQCTPTYGVTQVSPDKKAIIWNLGTKLRSRNNEFALHSVVNFQLPETSPNADSTQNKKEKSRAKKMVNQHLTPEEEGTLFCNKSSMYAEMVFKATESLIGNLWIDKRDIGIRGRKGVPCEITHILESGLFRIWNGTADALFATQPLDDPMSYTNRPYTNQSKIPDNSQT